MRRVLLTVVIGCALASTAAGAFAENFPYPINTPLASNAPWYTSGIMQDRILISSPGISVWSDKNGTRTPDSASVNLSESGVVSFTVQIRGPQPSSATRDWWYLYLRDENNAVLAQWSGTSNTAVSGGSTPATNGLTMIQETMGALIDFTKGTVDYSYAGTVNDHGTISGPGTTLARIDFVSDGLGYPDRPSLDEHLYFNLINVVPEPATMSLLGLGLAGLIARRRQR